MRFTTEDLDRSGETEVVIVGAGPVGLLTACELRRRGVKVRVLEKRKVPLTTSRAMSLFPRTLELLQKTGVADRMIAAGNEVETLYFVPERGPSAAVDVEHFPSPFKHLFLLPQTKTERLLEERLSELGAKVERGVELIRFTDKGEDVEVVARDLEGNEETFSAKWLIGCDGVRSDVRHLLGIPFKGWKYEEEYFLTDVPVKEGGVSENAGELILAAQGVVEIFPVGDGLTRIIIYKPPFPRKGDGSSEPEISPEAIEKVLAERGIERIKLGKPQWLSQFSISHRRVKEMRHGRVFLVGDAAHVHSPVGGQGMNMGIHDGANLGWKLAAVIRGEAHPALLDSYQQERMPMIRRVMRETALMTVALTFENSLYRWIRGLIVSYLLPIPWVMKQLSLGLSGLKVNFRHSKIVENGDGRTPAAGDRAPDALFGLEDPVMGKREISLYTLGCNPKHLLLLFRGTTLEVDEERLRELKRVRTRVETSFGAQIKVHEISEDGGSPNSPNVPNLLRDRNGEAHARYDLKEGGVVLIRPDGIIAFRSDWGRVDRLWDYLAALFIEAPASAPRG